MNSNYILPVSIAAAIHGVLLFGIPKVPRVPVVQTETRDVIRVYEHPKEIDPVEPVDAGSEANKQTEELIPPPPMQPEPLVPVVDSHFTFVPLKIEPSVPGVVATIVPVNLRTGPGSGIGDGPILPVHLDNSPRTRFQPAPHYPPGARAAGLTGEVLVEFTVDEAGRVTDLHVLKSSDRIFEESTLRAVAKWQFEPGRRSGRIVRFRMSVPVVFNLND